MCGNRSRRSNASTSPGSGGAVGTPSAGGVAFVPAVLTRSPHPRGPRRCHRQGRALRTWLRVLPRHWCPGSGSGVPRRGVAGRCGCLRGGPGSKRGRPRRTGHGPRRVRVPSRPRPGSKKFGQRERLVILTRIFVNPAAAASVSHMSAPSSRARNSTSAAFLARGLRSNAPAGAGGKCSSVICGLPGLARRCRATSTVARSRRHGR